MATSSERKMMAKAIKQKQVQISQVNDSPSRKSKTTAARAQSTKTRTNYSVPDVESSANYKQEITELWQTLKSATAAQREAILKDLPEDVINDLRTLGNPYKKPVFIGDKYKVLTFSVLNGTAKYYERFAMTSLIGFIYRMCEEWKPQSAESYPSEDEPNFAMLYNTKVQQREREAPHKALSAELDDLVAKIKNPEIPNSEQLDYARETFNVRARMIKYRKFYNNKDLTALKDERNIVNKELQTATTLLTKAVRDLEIAQIKLRKFQLHAAGRAEEITQEENVKFRGLRERIEAAVGPKRDQPLPPALREEQIEMARELFTAYDLKPREGRNGEHIEVTEEYFQRKLDEEEARVKTFTSQKETNTAKLQSIDAKIAEVQARISADEEVFSSLKSECDNMFGKGTSANFDEFKVERFELEPNEYDDVAEEVKRELGIALTAEEHTDNIRAEITRFLDEYMRYNPDNHVRCGYKPNYVYMSGNENKGPPTADEIIKNTLKMREEAETAYGRSVIPPDDTFYRWRRYTENNYEELRQATDDIWPERSELEFGIVPYEIFEGDNPDKVDAQVKEFQRKYASEVEADILAARFGIWTLLGPWSANREKRDFFNKDTEVIKRILDQNKEDEKLGMKINKQRAAKAKSKEVAKHGPDPPEFKAVRKMQSASLEKYGAKAFVGGTEIGRDDEISTKDEIEVGVHMIKPVMSAKGRIRGRADQWKFHIPAEAPGEKAEIKIMTPGESREAKMKEENKE